MSGFNPTNAKESFKSQAIQDINLRGYMELQEPNPVSSLSEAYLGLTAPKASSSPVSLIFFSPLVAFEIGPGCIPKNHFAFRNPNARSPRPKKTQHNSGDETPQLAVGGKTDP